MKISKSPIQSELGFFIPNLLCSKRDWVQYANVFSNVDIK
ncbi:hypothetical protein ADICYQ_4302 [Cyclobacterium qasimii M12-11B]|uniref:Uncharacterized protein n=1 Tax=Cyclobacterium qasimii M12-11B TaxID=641524 RepID=S7V917_9BACT|nr:hypothetical protein ADICYQ_4302 [Cyclobacterium qasimii M12-11B]